MERTDQYGECNMDNIPVDEFTAECCMRCVSPRCTRSFFGKSKFEIRTGSWYERLFSEVPKMDPDDPNYEKIAAQKFMPAEEPVAVNSDWTEPKDLPAPVPEPKIETKIESKSEPLPEETPPKILDPPPPPPPQEKGQLSRDLAYSNTPTKQGQMISGAKSKPQKDAWDAPAAPIDTNARVIKPGEKIKIG